MAKNGPNYRSAQRATCSTCRSLTFGRKCKWPWLVCSLARECLLSRPAGWPARNGQRAKSQRRAASGAPDAPRPGGGEVAEAIRFVAQNAFDYPAAAAAAAARLPGAHCSNYCAALANHFRSLASCCLAPDSAAVPVIACVTH